MKDILGWVAIKLDQRVYGILDHSATKLSKTENMLVEGDGALVADNNKAMTAEIVLRLVRDKVSKIFISFDILTFELSSACNFQNLSRLKEITKLLELFEKYCLPEYIVPYQQNIRKYKKSCQSGYNYTLWTLKTKCLEAETDFIKLFFIYTVFSIKKLG